MTKVNINILPDNKIVHKVGNFYANNEDPKEIYILSCVGNYSVMLISLKDGFRWNNHTRVNDYNDITQEEFVLITGNSEFKLIDQINISYE